MSGAGSFRLGDREVGRLGYGAMQLAGPGVFGPPRDRGELAHREDDALIDSLARDGIAYVPFFPLGGFTPLQSATLSRVAARLGATPMQIALAWLLHRAPNVLAIPGTSSVTHLRENLAAARIELPRETLAELDGIAAER